MPIEYKPHRASSSVLAHLDGLLDQALEQTFPASDAVAIDFERESHDCCGTSSRFPHSARWQPEGGLEGWTETLTLIHQRSSAYSPRSLLGCVDRMNLKQVLSDIQTDLVTCMGPLPDVIR